MTVSFTTGVGLGSGSGGAGLGVGLGVGLGAGLEGSGFGFGAAGGILLSFVFRILGLSSLHVLIDSAVTSVLGGVTVSVSLMQRYSVKNMTSRLSGA